MRFADRVDAGRKLAQALMDYRGQSAVVLALPRGGVPVALEVARVLEAPLDLILVRKIGVPGHEELAAAAVVDGAEPALVRNRDVIAMARLSDEFLTHAKAEKLKEIEARRQRYLGQRERIDLAGRTAIIVDDGLATGTTAEAAIKAVRGAGAAAIVLAVPVAPADSLARLRPLVDAAICLSTPDEFAAVGQFYRHFDQTSDDEVVALMRQAEQAHGG